MPPFPGEERLVTLFTDCHYYFAQPTARPALHRFDKASYFYIYWNSTRQTSRLEVANNAGTPEQDAFNGYLDTCRVINSDKFPTLVTLVVDGSDTATSPTSRAGRDPEEWRLSGADPRDPNQTRYRLHTIDFYFWTQEDARLVTDFLRKLLNPAQLDFAESRQSQQQQQSRRSGEVGVSLVVQNLENVAISDPAYGNGQTRNSRSQPQTQPSSIVPPPPPPPPNQAYPNIRATSAASTTSPSPISPPSQTNSRVSPRTDKTTTDYTPIPYNPAAPAAPEKIAHREKTPPPEDGVQGTGLSAAVMHDQVTMSGHNPSHTWGAPPAASQVTHPGSWGSPPPSSVPSSYGQQQSSVGYTSPPPGPQFQPSRTSATSAAPSFAPPPAVLSAGQGQHRHSVAAETYTPEKPSYESQPVETPGSQFYETIQQPSKPLAHIQPQYADYLAAGTKPGQQPPPGGFANYSYAQGSQFNPHGGSEYDVHNQVYRPAEAEVNRHKITKPSRAETAVSKNSKFAWIEKKAKGLKDKAERY